MERYELPDGWEWTTLGDACRINPTMTWPEHFIDETSVSFVPMAAVDEVSGAIVSAEDRPIADVWKGYKRFAEGDVIFARITPCMENGKAAIATHLTNGIGLGSTEFHVLRPTDAVTAAWIYHFVRQQSFRNEAARAMTGTAGQLRVPSAFLEQAPIPLPPLTEQYRVVAKIEALFAESRTAREELDRIPALLKQFRQSVLAAAFRGELVESDPDDEPASVLLERIRAERHHKWEDELRAKGKMPEAYTYEEPVAPDTSELPELPEGWCWGTIAELSKQIVDCLHTTPKFTSEGKYCIDTTCIEPGRIIFERARRVSEETYDDRVRRLAPQEGDVLFAREGTIGTSALVPKNAELCLGQRMMMFRPEMIILPSFFMWCLLSPVFVDQWKPKVTGTTSPHVNIGDLKEMCLPLAPLAKQRRIIARLQSLLLQADTIEGEVVAARKRLDRLDHSVLARAFRGELVAQDRGKFGT